MSRRPLRKLRTTLNLIVVVLLTLLANHFHQAWQNDRAAREIISLCQLPPLPDDLKVIYASQTDHSVALAITGPPKPFDAWLGQIDEWRKKTPPVLINFTIRESEQSIRMDFSAELRPEARK
ncbi:MAG: hypothetical protein ACSHYF_15855 [Verrucomicrobiaceae bacterium]